MGFSRQEYCSGLSCPPPRDLPDPGIEPMSLTSPALAGRSFTTSSTWEDLNMNLSSFPTPFHSWLGIQRLSQRKRSKLGETFASGRSQLPAKLVAIIFFRASDEERDGGGSGTHWGYLHFFPIQRWCASLFLNYGSWEGDLGGVGE